jgi:hypothetical protein
MIVPFFGPTLSRYQRRDLAGDQMSIKSFYRKTNDYREKNTMHSIPVLVVQEWRRNRVSSSLDHLLS